MWQSKTCWQYLFLQMLEELPWWKSFYRNQQPHVQRFFSTLTFRVIEWNVCVVLHAKSLLYTHFWSFWAVGDTHSWCWETVLHRICLLNTFNVVLMSVRICVSRSWHSLMPPIALITSSGDSSTGEDMPGLGLQNTRMTGINKICYWCSLECKWLMFFTSIPFIIMKSVFPRAGDIKVNCFTAASYKEVLFMAPNVGWASASAMWWTGGPADVREAGGRAGSLSHSLLLHHCLLENTKRSN